MREIILTGGEVALVDDDDFDRINQHRWSICSNGGSSYARRATTVNGKDVGLMMHRVIMGITDKSLRIDHKNRNGLDNQKHNLRSATPSQNSKNKKGWGSSKYLGVNRKKWRKSFRWEAKIKPDVKSKQVLLGYFKLEKDAALAYNEAAKKYHGEFANLNIL